MASLEERVRSWSYRRQRLGRAARDLPAVLRDVVAIYGSQPTAVLTLAARVRNLDPAAYRGLDADRTAARLPAMRLSSHLVPTETAARIFAATRRPLETLASVWRGMGLADDEYEAAKAAILTAATEPATVVDLRRRVGSEAATLLGRHPQAATLLVRTIRSEGLLIAIAPDSLRSNAFAYVATDAWLGAPLAPIDPDEALAWLAGEYLRAFGPARIEDFRWWAGTTAQRARSAFARHATIELDGGLLLPAEDLDAFGHPEPVQPDAIDLLPLWDTYTMGYAPDGRERLVRREHLARAYDTGGNGLGLVLRAGVAAGAWGLRFAGRRMEVSLDLFDPLTPQLRREMDDRLRDAAGLLGATDVAVTEGPPRGPGGPG